MQAPPHRLRSPGPLLPAAEGEQAESMATPGPAGTIRAARRLAAVLLVTALCIPVQAVFLLLPGRAKVHHARFYWATLARLVGMRVRRLGTPVTGRPVVFAVNHSSWLDIAAVGGTLEACFIAKAEVGRWPLIRTVARLGRTVFVSRRAGDTGRERDDMRARLRAGDNLILFPEGTSNDGSRVLPFRSAFFSISEGTGPDRPLIQPVSVVYDRFAGLPVGRASRVQFSWFGDMDLAPHFWKVARQRGGHRCTVLLHPPVDPADHPSRKELAAVVWATVAEGAAALRQNRATAV